MRELDTKTLNNAARDYARNWLMDDVLAPSGLSYRAGPSWVMECLYNADYKDEFEYLLKRLKGELSPRSLPEFERRAKEHFAPREDKVFVQLLEDKLAIDPLGNHVEGKIGSVSCGTRTIGWRYKVITTKQGREIALPKRVVWQIYAGEEEERAHGGGDPFPIQGLDWDPLMHPVNPMLQANVPTFSAEVCIGMLDFIDTSVNEGSTAATIRGRTGAQPADPDASETGTLLFTLTGSDPMFGAAADDADGTCSLTASAITDDSSADATGTLGYCRIGATGTGADDHIDGEAGTSGADFNFNTVSIVSGSTVSMTSLVIGLSQGSTAS